MTIWQFISFKIVDCAIFHLNPDIGIEYFLDKHSIFASKLVIRSIQMQPVDLE